MNFNRSLLSTLQSVYNQSESNAQSLGCLVSSGRSINELKVCVAPTPLKSNACPALSPGDTVVCRTNRNITALAFRLRSLCATMLRCPFTGSVVGPNTGSSAKHDAYLTPYERRIHFDLVPAGSPAGGQSCIACRSRSRQAAYSCVHLVARRREAVAARRRFPVVVASVSCQPA